MNRDWIQSLSEIFLRSSIEYAQIVVRSCFLMNGAALLAVPAYVGAVKDLSKINWCAVVGSFLFFALGVVTAVLCAYYSYMNLRRVFFAGAVDLEGEQAKGKSQKKSKSSSHISNSLMLETIFRNIKIDEVQSSVERFGRFSIWFGWAAVLSFIIGSGFSAWAMLS